MDEGRRKPAGSGVELLPHPHPEVRSPAHKSPPNSSQACADCATCLRSAVRRCASGVSSCRKRCRERNEDKMRLTALHAPRGLRGNTEETTRAWRENECACVNGRGCLTIESEKCRWAVEGTNITDVMAGLVPAIPIMKAPRSINRDHRDIPNQVEDRRPVMTG